MSYNSNTNISYPGPDWQILWPDGLDNFQLDIVGFLAILGEQSILANAQVSALSRLFLAPRLLPAPQALLRTTRPATLPPVSASVVSVRSGNKKNHIHHVASILLGTRSSELKKHWVRCVRVTKNDTGTDKRQTKTDHTLRGQQKQSNQNSGNPVSTVKAKAFGPLTWVTLLGIALTITIVVASIVYGDGMSLMATVALSLLSSVAGIANKWKLSLVAPPKPNKVSPEDMVVIRYPEGSFLVVKCDDYVARELFFAPEEINYTIKSSHTYRLLALVGSIMLMIGVILLANARLQLQLAWAGSYLILNAAHWAAAALPPQMHWDLSCYKLEEEGIEGGPANGSFTDALWKVIVLTKRHEWVRFGEAAPNTKAWDRWAMEAAYEAKLAPASDPKPMDLEKPCMTWQDKKTGSKTRGSKEESSKIKGIVHKVPKGTQFDDPMARFRAIAGEEARREALEAQEEGVQIELERDARAGADQV